jgi:hypothetical protein
MQNYGTENSSGGGGRENEPVNTKDSLIQNIIYSAYIILLCYQNDKNTMKCVRLFCCFRIVLHESD